MHCDVGFHYRHPPNEVKQVLEEAMRGCPGVLERPAPMVVVRGFADSAVHYELLYWITDFARDIVIESDVRTRIWYAAQRAGLEIPFPIRTVHMHQVTAETRRAEDERDYMDRLGALSKIDLFKTLDDADVDLLARGMHRRMWARGETLVRQGDPGDSMFLIAQGEVAVVLSVDGAMRQVATLRTGQLLGEQSLITGEPRAATCTAATDVVTHEISHALFQRLLEQKPQIAEDISNVLTERQMALDAEREGLSVEATRSRSDETRKHLLRRIRGFFHLG
jgi:CRP-like cAMP-binding protein